MQSKESDINEIMEQIVQFSEDRDWDQFHNGKDLALALSIEASELNEAFLWKSAEDVKKIVKDLVKEEEPEYKETTDIFDILLDKQDKAFKEAVMLHKRLLSYFPREWSTAEK